MTKPPTVEKLSDEEIKEQTEEIMSQFEDDEEVDFDEEAEFNKPNPRMIKILAQGGNARIIRTLDEYYSTGNKEGDNQ